MSRSGRVASPPTGTDKEGCTRARSSGLGTDGPAIGHRLPQMLFIGQTDKSADELLATEIELREQRDETWRYCHRAVPRSGVNRTGPNYSGWQDRDDPDSVEKWW